MSFPTCAGCVRLFASYQTANSRDVVDGHTFVTTTKSAAECSPSHHCKICRRGCCDRAQSRSRRRSCKPQTEPRTGSNVLHRFWDKLVRTFCTAAQNLRQPAQHHTSQVSHRMQPWLVKNENLQNSQAVLGADRPMLWSSNHVQNSDAALRKG